MTSDIGILYGINRHNKHAGYLDDFRWKTPTWYFAKSGSGKSYAQAGSHPLANDGVNVLIIDPENEYERLPRPWAAVTLKSRWLLNTHQPFEIPIIPPEKTGRSFAQPHVNLTGLIKLMVGERQL